jgi:peptide deformylase
MYKIRYIGDHFLRRQSEQITQFNTNLRKLINDMTDVMHREDGIGLAAPQIGIDKRIIVIDISSIEKEEKPRVFINPKIIQSSGESTVEEGCLSIPGVREDVARPEHIQLTYQNDEGELSTEEYDGWLARVLQHEIDHLDGILFVDHITPLKRQMLVQQGAIPETY